MLAVPVQVSAAPSSVLQTQKLLGLLIVCADWWSKTTDSVLFRTLQQLPPGVTKRTTRTTFVTV
jgi:hypothetical protein